VAEQRLKREHIALFLLWLGVTFADASEDWHFQQESRPALMYNDPVHASSLYMWWDELEYLIDSFWDADKADNTINSLQQSLEILRGEGVAEAECLGVLGFFYSSKGEAYNAFISWQQSIVFARAVGSQHIECASLFVLGYAYMKMNQIQQASECFEQSLTVAQKFGATSRRVLASWDFSDVLLQCSETEGSIKLMQVWMEFKRSFNDASVAKMERS